MRFKSDSRRAGNHPRLAAAQAGLHLRPLLALFDAWEWKAIIAAMLTLAAKLFAVETTAVGGVFAMMALDLWAGITAARRRGDFAPKLALKKTMAKITNYTIMMAALTVFSNAYAVGTVTLYGCMYLAGNELWSVFVNLNGLAKARRMWNAIKGLPNHGTERESSTTQTGAGYAGPGGARDSTDPAAGQGRADR